MIRDQRCGKRSDGSTKDLWSSAGAGGAADAAAGPGPGCARSAAQGGPSHPAPSPRLLPPARISFLNLKAKAAQVEMVISFRLRPKRNENSPLGQELNIFLPPPPPTKGPENLLEMLRAGVAIFRAARAGTANIFKS